VQAPAVETRGLTKIYRNGVVGIEDLDMTIEVGEVVGFVGPNGAGKTTTIRLLLDLLRPTRGEAYVLGLHAQRQSLEVRRRVGFLPGDLAFHAGLSGQETLDAYDRLRPGVAPTRRDELLESLELDRAVLSRRVSGYSTGMRRKLGLVVALQHDPDLAILDEPTTGLDPLVRRRYHATLRTWRGEQRTLFLCTHDMLEVDTVCDRVIIVRDGRWAASETVADLRARTSDARSLEDEILSYYRTS